jgi:DNA-binding CsgD family transcriptional regulator
MRETDERDASSLVPQPSSSIAGTLATRIQALAIERDLDFDISLSGKPLALPESVALAVTAAIDDLLVTVDGSSDVHHLGLAIAFSEELVRVRFEHDGSFAPAMRPYLDALVYGHYERIGGFGGTLTVSAGRGYGVRVEMAVPYQSTGGSAERRPLDAISARLRQDTVVEGTPPMPAERLTPQEEACLVLLSAGYSNKEIAARLKLSVGTVKFHLAQIYQKLGVQGRGRGAAVARARELGLIFD